MRIQPAAIERQAMGDDNCFGLIDIGGCHRLAEILLQEHLQAEEHDVGLIRMPARLDIGADTFVPGGYCRNG